MAHTTVYDASAHFGKLLNLVKDISSSKDSLLRLADTGDEGIWFVLVQNPNIPHPAAIKIARQARWDICYELSYNEAICSEVLEIVYDRFYKDSPSWVGDRVLAHPSRLFNVLVRKIGTTS